ncbi:uncharacterized protein THITE_2116108 [Thermothielavioides terrestris NRRL 8126]|uniref:Zn(2)-C6 fungal-type domain-containing protein n=1 Tax=Thermothielavioides terrestris (strain ATCC 38088 / NRRL 8126) TaxID=578455 RepID=G2QZW0_THETT|nr:uncharacterized protein THITE_2116108 [Thermothielavioides terrestris NRRL 8126]AEO67234.1 hypothetical protein THITE_2116108 [Thermothielavioides terrestris NRRL 8126]
MAQPPEAAPSRLQLSLDSDPAAAQPRLQTSLDALGGQKYYHHDQPQHNGQQQQQQQQQQQPHQEPPVGAQPSEAPRTWDLPGIGSAGTHSIGDGKHGRSPGVGGETAGVDAVSTVNGSSINHASAAVRLADPAAAIRDGRSETHQNGGAAVPSLPDMSNAQPPPGPARQPVTYAPPPAYPSAGIPPVPQYVYSPHSIPAADPYRASPTTLPSMRTLDPRQAHGQTQHGLPLGAHLGSPMAPAPPPAPAHMGYYNVHPHTPIYGLTDPHSMRFALGPGLAHDPRIALSGGRHKKEIKRRTKTGCLTCRKRRIKCDEAHPTCNNCKKSKRECLGYDPIFKQQQGPAAIQPAPSTQAPVPPAAAAAVPAPAPSLPSSVPHPYQGASYPPPLPSSIPAADPVRSTAPQSTSAKPEAGYDYSTAIDPALQGGDAAGATGSRAPRYPQNNVAVGTVQATGDSIHSRAKKMKVDELIALGGAAPVPSGSPPSPEMVDEITKLYYEIYVPGLASFFETQWYDFAKRQAPSTNTAAVLHSNQSLVSLFALFIQTISKISSTDPADLVQSSHLETSVVWSLARLPLTVNSGETRQYPDPYPAQDDLWETRGRLQVFETLITGETLTANPLTRPPPPAADNVHSLRQNELEFWYQLADYLLQDHATASAAHVAARERCLSVMRALLDGRENRDVLYSIAVLREYTAHWDACWNEQTAPSHLQEADARSRLAVATRFIRDESTSTGGTTNVVRRFADLAYRAFVRPGVNVDRSRGSYSGS